jgi:Bacterial mobilisation protein (MobC)
VTPEVKRQVGEALASEFLSESAWLRRLVLRELQGSVGPRVHTAGETLAKRGECAKRREPYRSLHVRLRPDDRLVLHERAAGRGMAAATYVAVLVRSHLRGLAPLPKEELRALKSVVAELGAIGRNLNQVARSTNSGAISGAAGREEFKAILKVCEALRDHTKNLIKSNTTSWESGHAEL